MVGEIAAIYARVSTGKQAKDDKVSIPDQIRLCLERAERDGFTVPKKLIFEDRVSGALGEDERPGFKAMMDAARSGRYRRLYFYNGTRFARDDAIATSAFKELRGLEVDYVSLNDPDLRHTLTRGMVISFAQYEKELIAQRTKNGKNAKRDKGLFVTGTIPYGYRRGPNQTLALCDVEGPVLRRIYQDMIDGKGRVSITRELNAEGVAPPFAWVIEPGKEEVTRLRMNQIGGFEGLDQWLADHPGARPVRPPRWSEGVVSQLIKKTVNYGVLAGRKLIIHGGTPVTQSMYDAALKATRSRLMKGSKPRNKKLLTGKIRCGNPECRRHYAYHSSGHVKNAAHSYICNGKRGRTGCENSNVSMRVADDLVLRAVSRYLTERPGDAEKDSRAAPAGHLPLPARLNRSMFYQFLMEQGLRKKEDIGIALGEAQAALTAMETDRKAITATAIDLKKMGCTEADLEEIASQLADLTPKIEGKRREIDDLVAELSQTSVDLAADEAEAAEAAAYAEDALWLSPLEESDILAPVDPREVIKIMVREVVVLPKDLANTKQTPADRVVVRLDKSSDALRKVVRLLAGASLERIRTLKKLEERRHTEPGNVVDLGFERDMVRIGEWAAKSRRVDT